LVLLSEAGCHLGQGFGYARPQPAVDLFRLLQMPEASGIIQVLCSLYWQPDQRLPGYSR